MLVKLYLICTKTKGFHAKIRCNLNDISYLSETQTIIFNSYNYKVRKRAKIRN